MPFVSQEEKSSERKTATMDEGWVEWTLSYRLRGGAEGELPLPGDQWRRLQREVQGESGHAFVSFDSGDRWIALNLDHLLFCQFLFDLRPVISSGCERGTEVGVLLAGDKEPFMFDVEPDSASLLDAVKRKAGEERVQLQSFVYLGERVIRGEDTVVHFDDVDGDAAFFRANDVAMISVPLDAIDPERLKAEDDGEEEEA